MKFNFDIKKDKPTNKCDNPRCNKLKCHHTFQQARDCQQAVSGSA